MSKHKPRRPRWPASINTLGVAYARAAHMRADIPLLMQCQGLAYVMGAATPRQMQLSKGLRLERLNAEALGMPMHPVQWWIDQAAAQVGGATWPA